MSAALEKSYKRMLGLYPRKWREQHGPAMLGTMLDAAEAEGRNRPTFAERLDLAVNAVLARFSTVLPPQLRNGVATAALATGTAFALVYVAFAGWAPFMRNRDYLREIFSFGPFMNPGVILCGVWALAFLFVMLGWRHAAKAALLGSIAIAIALPLLNQFAPEWGGMATRNLGFLGILAVFALLGTPESRPRVALWATAWLVGLVCLYAGNGMLNGDSNDRGFWSRIATPTNIWLGACLALIITVCFVAMKRPQSALVLLWSLAPWLAAGWVGTYIDAADIALALVLGAAGIATLGIAARFALRRAGISIRIVKNSDQ